MSDDVGAVSAFELLGGEVAVRGIVDRFYDLMDLEPEYAALRATHGSTLDSARDKLFWFLCGWLGGPHYTQRFGHLMLRAPSAVCHRHPRTRPVAGLHEPGDARARGRSGDGRAARQAFFGTADWMRNKGG